jgi:flagellar motor switch protein FliG
MASAGIRKAAMLLMGLDAGSAAELLREAPPELITQIAAELAYLRASGAKPTSSADPLREFCTLLQGGGDGVSPGDDFVQDLLAQAVGAEKSRELMQEVEDIVEQRDPFLPLRSASAADLAAALEGESPQAVAVVLSELPSARSAELIPLLPEDKRLAAVQGLACSGMVSSGARLRVANVIRERLADSCQENAPQLSSDPQRQKLRKVALLVRGLDATLREALIESVAAKDPEVGKQVRELMIIWEDLAHIDDRSVQQVMRSIEPRMLAVALSETDPAVTAKIRQNISGRFEALLQEEIELLSSPKDEDVRSAREAILEKFRELNQKGDLRFEKG